MTKKSIYASLILLLITTFTFSSSASFANVKNNTNITHNDKGVNVIITRANVTPWGSGTFSEETHLQFLHTFISVLLKS